MNFINNDRHAALRGRGGGHPPPLSFKSSRGLEFVGLRRPSQPVFTRPGEGLGDPFTKHAASEIHPSCRGASSRTDLP